MNTPLSQSSVSLKLEEIQRRCEELNEAPQELLELKLEDPEFQQDGSDPYNRVRS
jgi:hypothetical protein